MTQRVLASFENTRVKHGGASLFYVVGLIGALAVLLMLTLIYLAMVAGAGWLLYLHVSTNFWWFDVGDRAQQRVFMMLAYLIVAFVGSVLVVFLVKPLFAPAARRSLPVTLDPIQEPALFALIHRICDVVGAPRPAEVRVDCHVNASAGLRRGMASLFSGDLSLTIGMPLVAGLTARQLAGVLAHEFGHFSQGAGMRLSYLVRSYHHWFARLVYERDGCDKWLEGLATDDGADARMLWRFVRRCVQAERAVLSWLMHAGGFFSGFLSRQMEYDADRYEALVAGTGEFAFTTRRFRALNVAHDQIIQEAQRLWSKGELPDNVPEMVARREREMPKEIRHKVERMSADEETRWWSTHPADEDRIAAVEKMSAPGVFRLEVPAATLFRDFAELSRTVSIHWYEVDLGLDLNHVNLLGSAQAEAVQTIDSGRQRALSSFFGGTLFADRLLPVPMAAPEQWKAAAEYCKRSLRDYAKSAQVESDACARLMRHSTGCELLDVGYRVEHLTDFFMESTSEATARQMLGKMQIEHTKISARMRIFEEAAWTRITAALAWKFNDPSTDEDWKRHVTRLVSAERVLAEACAKLREGWIPASTTSALMHLSGGLADPSQILECASKHDRILRTVMESARSKLSAAEDPYAATAASLARTLWTEEPQARFAVETFGIFERAVCVHAVRISGDLCLMAHEVEKSWSPAAKGAPPSADHESTSWCGLAMAYQ